MRRHAPLLAAVALAHALLPAHAGPEPATLDPLVVTATGHETPASEALAAITVIPREEIERSLATDVAELLRFHAGVDLGRNGGPGQTTSVFIRGGESNHTLVLVNGVRVNPATSGGAALQNITPEMIERIEIVRGPRATLYGSDAIGGVINVITRAPAGAAGEARYRGGSQGTADGSLFVSAGGEDSGLALHGQRLTTDGIPSCAGASADRGFEQTTVNLQGQLRVAGVRLSGHGWNSEGNAEYLDFCDPVFGFNPRDQDYRNRVVALEAAWSGTHGVESWVRANYMTDDIRQNQSADFVRTERPAAGWHVAKHFAGGHRLQFGLEAAREQVDALSFGSPVSEDRDLHGALIQYELGSGPHRALLALSRMDHDAFGARTNWNAEYGIDVLPATRLIAAAGTGFRAPDATDRFGFGGNPDLEPEEAVNYELGVRHEVGRGHTVELRGFIAEVENLISVECVANCADADPFNDVFQAQNVDRYRNDGVELAYRAEYEYLSVRLSALKQDPRSEERPDPCSGQARLCRRAAESAAASLVGRYGPAYAGLDVLGSGERVDFGGARLPGYALLNLTAGVELLRNWRIAARLENVLDKDYQTAAGFNQPGRSGYVTLRLTLP